MIILQTISATQSMGDLMIMSPKKSKEISENPNVTGESFMSSDVDSICDVTMLEIPTTDGVFIDANSLDYLVKYAESNGNQTSIDRGKESLLEKFDPLYAKQKSTSLSSNSTDSAENYEYDIGYETGSSTSTDIPVAAPRLSVSMGEILSKEKSPISISEIPKVNASNIRSNPVLIRSVSAILPPRRVATERLINISSNTMPTAVPRSSKNKRFSNQEVDRTQSVRTILENQVQEVLQLRQESNELKSSLQDLEHKQSRKIEELKSKIKKLMNENKILSESQNKLQQQVNDKTLNSKQLTIVIEECEKTVSSLIGEHQRERIQCQEITEQLILERDEALNHLANMERSFSDLLAKYEKCKSTIMDWKEREEIFKEKIIEYEMVIKQYKEKYNNLKMIASEKLENANETLENITKNHNIKLLQLNAIIKKQEISISSLQESVEHKTRDNEKLTKVCDQLINEVR